MTAHPNLSDWPDDRRFSELVARHRSGFVSGVMPLDCSQFGPSTLPEDCAPEGAAPTVSYEDGIADLEADSWVYVAIALGCIGGALLSVMFPSGFVPW